MIFHKSVLMNANQRGFTLIEMIVVVAITGLIAAGASIAIVQVLNQSTRNTDYAAASRNTLNAINWISRDAQMAQIVEPNGASGFPLVLKWVEWDNSNHQVVYMLENDKIQRSYSVDGGEPSKILIAEFINPETQMTNCVSDNNVLTLKVTASVGEGSQQSNVTKVHEISSRPGL
jgi:prepilin-type N-terminal cleavage/methylation domain-containing protein